MKYGLLLGLVCTSCLVAFGEVSEDQLKEAGKQIQMQSIRNRTEKDRSGNELEMLEIDFSSREEGLGGIYIRVAVEVTDKKTKQAYLVEETGGYPERFDRSYSGEGHWRLEIPYGEFDKLKLTGYVVEFGLVDGQEFVPFDGDYDDVDTYEELIERTKTAFPSKCSLRMTYMVDQ